MLQSKHYERIKSAVLETSDGVMAAANHKTELGLGHAEPGASGAALSGCDHVTRAAMHSASIRL
jgi:hypothetical protein